ncbi:MAG: GAF domain-containing protein, partial [Anaerolineales bacterium]|nr:GAF domain-containing protein [Anaerolineales bacterium]
YTGHPCHFSDKDAQLLQTFANLGAAAKINTQAFAALTQLHSAGEWMLHADSLHSALQQIYENVPNRVTGDGVFVIPCTDNYQRLDFKRAAGIGLGQSAVLWENSARQHESLREALEQYEVIHVPDISVPSGEVYLSRQTRDNFINAGIFGFIGVPLFSSAGNTLQGILFVNYRSATSLALLNQDETLLKIYADLAAIALERTRSQERAARERALLASLASITATSSSVKEICQFILDEAVAHAGATQGNISRILPGSTILRDVASHGVVWVGAAQDLDFSQTSEQGVQGYVAHNKESVLIHDVRAPEWQHIYVTGNPDTRSELTVPLLAGKDGELIGVLNLESTETYAFSDWDRSLMEALALHAALAIQNGDRREKLTEYNERFKAIANSFHLSRELNDRETMLQAILEMAASKTGATIATIQKIVGDQLSLESVYPPEFKSIVRAQIGDALPLDGPGITVAVANQGIPIRVNDVSSENSYLDGTGGRSAAELAIPLFHNNIVWGVLNVESARFNAFSDDDAILLSAIGNIAINALQGRKYARELSRTNTVALIGTWGAQIFHDVNRAMRNISFGVKSIRLAPELPDNIDSPLQDIEAILKQLSLPADLSALPLPGETIDIVTDVDYCLKQLLRTQQDELTQQAIGLQQTYTSAGALAAIHFRWLHFIVQHLINNAKRYVPSDGGQIIISTRRAGNQVVIQVADNGPGIDPSVRHRIFSEPVDKGTGEKEGLGLLLVGFMVDVHMGSYKIIHSDEQQGTCIELSFPITTRSGNAGGA